MTTPDTLRALAARLRAGDMTAAIDFGESLRELAAERAVTRNCALLAAMCEAAAMEMEAGDA